MDNTFNVYCDESCHLQFDRNDIMVLGSLYCESKYAQKINKDIYRIKAKHGLNHDFEIKWTKTSIGKIDFYLELVNYFFDSPFLSFRGVIATNKSKLDHESFNQTHDEWYYKMYFLLLREVVGIGDTYRIFVDIKDTKGADKVERLKTILNRSLYNFYSQTVERIQIVRSDEISILQLTDLIIGALSYINRGLTENEGKVMLIEAIQRKSGYNLISSTPKYSHKFNLFVWHPGEVRHG